MIELGIKNDELEDLYYKLEHLWFNFQRRILKGSFLKHFSEGEGSDYGDATNDLVK